MGTVLLLASPAGSIALGVATYGFSPVLGGALIGFGIGIAMTEFADFQDGYQGDGSHG